MKKSYLMLVVAILISGCATASFTQTGQTFAKYEGPVRVLTEVPENTEYVEIGIVSSKGGSIHNDVDLIKALQKKAAKNGANAILLATNRETQGFVASQYYSGTTSSKEITAFAIRIGIRYIFDFITFFRI